MPLLGSYCSALQPRSLLLRGQGLLTCLPPPPLYSHLHIWLTVSFSAQVLPSFLVTSTPMCNFHPTSSVFIPWCSCHIAQLQGHNEHCNLWEWCPLELLIAHSAQPYAAPQRLAIISSHLLFSPAQPAPPSIAP